MFSARDEIGAIDINLLYDNNMIKVIQPFLKMRAIIEYEGDIYYLKYAKGLDCLYNEMIGEFLTNDYGLTSTYNDIFVFNNNYGLLSKEFKKKEDKFIPMSKIISDEQNNLEDIWISLQYYLKDSKMVEKIMEEIVHLFIFDVLIANSDRHTENYGLIQRENQIFLSTIFDNEFIGKALDGEYSIGIDDRDSENIDCVNFLDKFLTISDSSYLDLFKSKLWIISSDNIHATINKIEQRIGKPIDVNIKEKIIRNFASNRLIIDNVLNKHRKVMKL